MVGLPGWTHDARNKNEAFTFIYISDENCPLKLQFHIACTRASLDPEKKVRDIKKWTDSQRDGTSEKQEAMPSEDRETWKPGNLKLNEYSFLGIFKAFWSNRCLQVPAKRSAVWMMKARVASSFVCHFQSNWSASQKLYATLQQLFLNSFCNSCQVRPWAAEEPR